MRQQPRPAFPDLTGSLLAQLGQALRERTVPQGLLDEALAQLGALPPEGIVRANRPIADTAQLLREYPAREYPARRRDWRSWLPEFGPRRPSQLALLARTPRLERLFVFHHDDDLREAALRKG